MQKSKEFWHKLIKHFQNKIGFDKNEKYKYVSDDLYRNGIFDNNDNRIVNDVSKKIKTVDELNNSNIKKKNNMKLKQGVLCMENKKVKYLINMINDMDIKDKLRLAICMSQSKWTGLIYNTKENYEKFDNMLKDIDEEYKTTLINFAKYKMVMFAMAKLIINNRTK